MFPLQNASQRGKTDGISQNWKFFGYVQGDIEVLENLREAFSNFPPISKNINVGRGDIGPLMKKCAEKEGILTQPTRILKSRNFLKNGTTITPFLLFFLDLRLVRKRNLRFVQ